MKIFIDADGCPVVDITIAIADKYKLPVTIVCDTAHNFSAKEVTVITVDKGADSADIKLANLIGADDIAVTQDYGLAALCLSKRAHALDQNGMAYTEGNIDALLLSRYTAKKLRNSGKRLKGPKKRIKENDIRFADSLERLIKNITADNAEK